MEDRFKPLDCNDDDVLSFGDATFKVGILRKAVHKSFGNDLGYSLTSQLSNSQGVRIDSTILAPQGMNQPYARWFGDGIDCEILNLGSKSWKKGKVRIKVSVEFYAEEPEVSETPASDGLEINEPESPLDDLRQMINQEIKQQNS
jgi:hypothetical protein